MPTHYPLARRGYLEWYSHLILPPDPNDIDSDEEHAIFLLLAHRLEGFNLASEEFTQATRPFLHAPMTHQRSQALHALLLQIEGDLGVAEMAWSMIEAGHKTDDALTIMRSLKQNPLKELFKVLSLELPADLTAEPTFIAPSSRLPASHEAAVEAVRYEVYETIELVLNRVSNVGMRVIRDTLGDSDSLAGLDLLKGSDQLGAIGWGLEDHVEANARELAGALRGILSNVVGKLLMILEHNDLVRYTIGDWLDDLQGLDPSQQKARFGALLEQLYQTRDLQHDAAYWLRDSHDLERMASATRQIHDLNDDFEALVNLVRRATQRLGQAELFRDNPFLGQVYSAVQIGLLGILVFAGYDYLDEGKRALNITRGVKEILIETLPVSRQTLEEAENIRVRVLRL
jgi:hypothetical protein